VYVLIDLAQSTVELAEPDDLKRFHVAVANGRDVVKVDELLRSGGVGRLDPTDADHVWVDEHWVEAQAAPRVHESWTENFHKMLASGAEHGWYDAEARHIKAHVEWMTPLGDSIESGPTV